MDHPTANDIDNGLIQSPYPIILAMVPPKS
jgi:hypothetical protein